MASILFGYSGRFAMIARVVGLGLLPVCSLLGQVMQSAKSSRPDTVLKVSVGGYAPDFDLKDVTGKVISLSEFRKKKFVVLAFYVFAFTPGCGDELIDLQSRISGPDVQIIGISMDSMFSNTEFASQLGVSYPLLSDKAGAVTRRYGLYNPTVYAARRATLLIDKHGKIMDIQLDHNALNAKKTLQALDQLRAK
jgi:mycoredoxin-dependent peroxiredoxin